MRKKDIITNEIKKKIGSELVITEVFDEVTGDFSSDGIEFQNGVIKGESLGRYHIAVELGIKTLEMLEMVQLETGLTIEELMYLKKNKEDID
ncbi:hypothetical protein [Candidatus Clostridium helianthi]|jgi:hypothetical protein|uniref:Uncharacterized protein n=1 Tax=Candidatus Clostridium helianthi TaxID=3381660 RepID=A0ABW8S1Y6_9CLOT